MDQQTTYKLILLELNNYQLTNRERQIASFWIMDHDYKEIAKELNISEHTVRTHLRNIYSKLPFKSKTTLLVRLVSKLINESENNAIY